MRRTVRLAPLLVLASIPLAATAAAADDRASASSRHLALELRPGAGALGEQRASERSTQNPRLTSPLCGDRPCVAALAPQELLHSAATAAPGGGHRLMIRLRDRDLTSRVEVTSSAGTQTCEVFSRHEPCILSVPSGTATIRATGDVEVEKTVEITPGENVARISRDYSPLAGTIYGGVLLGIGLGVGIPAVANDCIDELVKGDELCGLWLIGSGVVAGLGTLFLALSVPSLAFGDDRFSFENGYGSRSAAPAKSSAVPQLAVGYAPRHDRKSIQATWQF